MIDRSKILHSPSCACVLSSEYLDIFKSFEYDYWVSGTVGKSSVIGWSVVVRSTVGGFDKTMHYNILDLLKFRVTLLCLELNILFSVQYGQCYDFLNQSDCIYCCYDNCL